MDNILITGAGGQLGSEIRLLAGGNAGCQFFFTDTAELDITDSEAINQFLTEHSITKIVNCAAYNNVDGAESDPDSAIRINVHGTYNLAMAAAAKDIIFVHISSDFVFDGNKRTPYHESDRPNPISEYGKSKLAGEVAFRKSGCKGIIIRTSWLYSPLGQSNFVKTMLRLADEVEEIKVVYDQVGTPTYAKDLAAAILHILPQLDEIPRYGEVFHYSNEGHCSKAEFAAKIMQVARLDCDIIPISSEEYRSAARRPQYSVLDKSMIKKVFGVEVPLWERSLSKAVRLFRQ